MEMHMTFRACALRVRCHTDPKRRTHTSPATCSTLRLLGQRNAARVAAFCNDHSRMASIMDHSLNDSAPLLLCGCETRGPEGPEPEPSGDFRVFRRQAHRLVGVRGGAHRLELLQGTNVKTRIQACTFWRRCQQNCNSQCHLLAIGAFSELEHPARLRDM